MSADGGYANVPNSPSIAFTGPFTLEAWFTTTVTRQQEATIERYDQPYPDGYVMRIGDDGHLYGFVNAPTTFVSVEGTSVVTPNVRHHAVATCDGSAIKIYLDGFLAGAVDH